MQTMRRPTLGDYDYPIDFSYCSFFTRLMYCETYCLTRPCLAEYRSRHAVNRRPLGHKLQSQKRSISNVAVAAAFRLPGTSSLPRSDSL